MLAVIVVRHLEMCQAALIALKILVLHGTVRLRCVMLAATCSDGLCMCIWGERERCGAGSGVWEWGRCALVGAVACCCDCVQFCCVAGVAGRERRRGVPEGVELARQQHAVYLREERVR